MGSVSTKYCLLAPPGQQQTIPARKIVAIGSTLPESGGLLLANGNEGSVTPKLHIWFEDDGESTMSLVVLPDGTTFEDEQIEHVQSFQVEQQMFHIYRLRPEFVAKTMEQELLGNSEE